MLGDKSGGVKVLFQFQPLGALSLTVTLLLFLEPARAHPCPQEYPSSFYFVSQIKHVILTKLGKTHGYMKCVKL